MRECSRAYAMLHGKFRIGKLTWITQVGQTQSQESLKGERLLQVVAEGKWERQQVRRIRGTIAGLKMEGATWQRMWMTSGSREQLLANENGNFSPTPQITGLYHQPEWPCKQIFPKKSSQANTLIAALWFREYRTTHLA